MKSLFRSNYFAAYLSSLQSDGMQIIPYVIVVSTLENAKLLPVLSVNAHGEAVLP